MSDKEQEQTPLPSVGPELDRLVAAKMGYEWEPFESGSGPSGEWVIPGTNRTAYDVRWIHRTGLFQPQYSTDISAAWEIIEHLKGKELEVHLDWLPTENKWETGIYFPDEMVENLHYGGVENEGDTAPLAICAAFLALPDFEVKP